MKDFAFTVHYLEVVHFRAHFNSHVSEPPAIIAKINELIKAGRHDELSEVLMREFPQYKKVLEVFCLLLQKHKPKRVSDLTHKSCIGYYVDIECE